MAIRPQTDPSVVDLYFDFWQPSSSYTLNLTFANGSTLTIQTSIVLSTAALSTDATATLTATPLGWIQHRNLSNHSQSAHHKDRGFST